MPGLKVARRLLGTSIFSPVWGLRPEYPSYSLGCQEHSPRISTLSPLVRELAMELKKVSTMLMEWVSERSYSLDSRRYKSLLFINMRQ